MSDARRAEGRCERRRQLVRDCGGRCSYCGCWVTRPRPGVTRYTDSTIDHVVPRCLGGSDEPENLTLACWLCNHLKGGMHPVVLGLMLRLVG